MRRALLSRTTYSRTPIRLLFRRFSVPPYTFSIENVKSQYPEVFPSIDEQARTPIPETGPIPREHILQILHASLLLYQDKRKLDRPEERRRRRALLAAGDLEAYQAETLQQLQNWGRDLVASYRAVTAYYGWDLQRFAASLTQLMETDEEVVVIFYRMNVDAQYRGRDPIKTNARNMSETGLKEMMRAFIRAVERYDHPLPQHPHAETYKLLHLADLVHREFDIEMEDIRLDFAELTGDMKEAYQEFIEKVEWAI